MTPIAFMFPGQGSQEIGMGRDLGDDPRLRHFMTIGSDLVHHDLQNLSLKGPESLLRRASFLQPALAAVSLALFRRLVDNGVRPTMVLGHSLGEIVALGASGVVGEEEAITIAARRGELMDQAAHQCNGGMMAVIFVPVDTVRGLIGSLGLESRVVLANDNGPDQTVLSGEIAALEEMARHIAQEKLGKTQILPVVGPWHSPHMEESRQIFESWVAPRPFKRPSIPMLFNAKAGREEDPDTIKRLVTWQLTRPVFWRQCMEALHELGVETLVEVGPGRVLSGLARVNGYKRGSKVYSAASVRGIETIVGELTTVN